MINLPKRILKRFVTRHDLFVWRYRLSPELPAVRAFHNTGRGRRCFILGGGPSLKKIDPAKLRREVTFGVNAIYLIADWLGFHPTYYVVEDTLVVKHRGPEIAAYHGPRKFYDARYNQAIPPDPNTCNLRMFDDYSDYAGFPEFSTNAAKGVWCGQTVTYLCLQLAYYMGYDPVCLVGMDHSYQRPAHVKTEGDVWTSHGDDPNHFHPDYFGKGKQWHDPHLDRMELAYHRARREYEAAGRTILNATVGGHLEVFDRVSFTSLVG